MVRIQNVRRYPHTHSCLESIYPFPPHTLLLGKQQAHTRIHRNCSQVSFRLNNRGSMDRDLQPYTHSCLEAISQSPQHTCMGRQVLRARIHSYRSHISSVLLDNTGFHTLAFYRMYIRPSQQSKKVDIRLSTKNINYWARIHSYTSPTSSHNRDNAGLDRISYIYSCHSQEPSHLILGIRLPPKDMILYIHRCHSQQQSHSQDQQIHYDNLGLDILNRMYIRPSQYFSLLGIRLPTRDILNRMYRCHSQETSYLGIRIPKRNKRVANIHKSIGSILKPQDMIQCKLAYVRTYSH